MPKFVSLPSVKNQHDAAGLRKLFDQVESSVRYLKSLKVETNKYFLKRELEAKERSLLVGTTFSDKRKQSFDNEVFSSSALLNQGLNSNHKKERRACAFCGLSNYKSHKCLKVTNPSARKEVCKKNKICFVCFENGHNVNSCSREDYKCKNCNGKHNFSICTFNKNLLQSRFDT